MWGRQGDVEALLRRIEVQRTRVETLRKEIDQSLSEQRLYSAKTAVSSLLLESPDYRFRDGRTGRDIAAAISLSLTKVDLLLEKGANYRSEKRLNDAVLAYEAVLAVAKDCGLAKEALGKMPPRASGEGSCLIRRSRLHH